MATNNGDIPMGCFVVGLIGVACGASFIFFSAMDTVKNPPSKMITPDSATSDKDLAGYVTAGGRLTNHPPISVLAPPNKYRVFGPDGEDMSIGPQHLQPRRFSDAGVLVSIDREEWVAKGAAKYSRLFDKKGRQVCYQATGRGLRNPHGPPAGKFRYRWAGSKRPGENFQRHDRAGG